MNDMTSKDACDERHKHIDDELRRHDDILNEHGGMITELQRSDATNTTMIDNLIKSIDAQSGKLGGLTKALWGCAGSVIAVLAGFFIWFIQTH